MSERIELLKKFMEEDSADPFIHYALALEYAKADQQQAIDMFELMLHTHRNYLPIYYQLAKLYEMRGQKENAVRTFDAGIILAKNQNDLKTLRELKAALEEIEDLH